MPNHFSWMLKKANLSSSSSPPPSFPLWGPRKARKKLLPPTQKSLSPPFPFPPDKHEGSRVGLGWVGLGWQLFSARDIYQRDMLTEEEEGRERERERARERRNKSPHVIRPLTNHWRKFMLAARKQAKGTRGNNPTYKWTKSYSANITLVQRLLSNSIHFSLLLPFPTKFCVSPPSSPWAPGTINQRQAAKFPLLSCFFLPFLLFFFLLAVVATDASERNPPTFPLYKDKNGIKVNSWAFQ